MSTLRPKDRAKLCSFTFADGRRCRTPRSDSHAHLCYFHARKEAQTRARVEIGEDIGYYLSGQYLSASDLSCVLGRLFTAVVEGNIKPKTATTLAYLSQTLLQSIQLARQEYISAFGPLAYREAVTDSVNNNFSHKYPNTEKTSDQDPDQGSEQAAITQQVQGQAQLPDTAAAHN